MKILGYLAYLSVVGFTAASLVENWFYIVQEGFIKWLVFGWVIAEFKALIWPLNVLERLLL